MRSARTAYAGGVVIAVLILAGSAAGAPPLEDLPWLDPEETAALLADLEEAGLVPSDVDLRDLGVVEQPAPDPAVVEARAWPTGSCRLAAQDDGRLRASLDGRAAAIGFRLRARGGTAGPAEVGGCAWADGPSWAAAAGGVGVYRGLGLLAAGPGRGRTLSVCGSLNAAASGPRHWSSADGTTGARGVVGQGRVGAFTAGAMVGRQAATTTAPAAAENAAWLEYRRGPLAIGGLVEPGAGERGRSLAVAVDLVGLQLRAETARWAGLGTAGRAAATAGSVRWGSRKVMIEAQGANAAASAGPRHGARPACLIGWDGWGWAARGRVGVGPSLALTVLAAAAEDRPTRTLAQDRDMRLNLEIGLAGRAGPRGTWTLRWRRREDTRWHHDDAAPWLPAANAGDRTTDTWVGEGTLTLDRGEVTGALRVVAVDEPTGQGRRAVASARWRGPWGPFRATIGGTWAWGDPVSVATVTTPVAGLAVARAWGAWAAEFYAGADLRLGRARIQAAAARRTPAIPATALTTATSAAWQAWACLAVDW